MNKSWADLTTSLPSEKGGLIPFPIISFQASHHFFTSSQRILPLSLQHFWSLLESTYSLQLNLLGIVKLPCHGSMSWTSSYRGQTGTRTRTLREKTMFTEEWGKRSPILLNLPNIQLRTLSAHTANLSYKSVS